MRIEHFFHQASSTLSYLVVNESSGQCALIDPVLDFDLSTGEVSTTFADMIIDHIQLNAWSLDWILETHLHADHLTASAYIKETLGAKTGTSSAIREVLRHWVPMFHWEEEIPLDGSQYDTLFDPGDTFMLGDLAFKVIDTPGHTSDSCSYLVGDACFVGDSLFSPELGCARCDFPGGSAKALYQSIQRLYALGDDTRLFVGHDYPGPGRSPDFVSTVKIQRETNHMLSEGVTEQTFIEKRQARDSTLDTPKLLYAAIQVNLRAGLFPLAEANGERYLKIPLRGVEHL